MKSASELLADVIPTKWSQAIVVLTVGLIPLAYNAPSLLPPTWLPSSSEQIFLIRLLLSALSAFLGSLVLLILMLRHIKYLNTEIATKSDQPKINVLNRLEPECEKVLNAFILNERLYENQLENKLIMNKDRAIFHLTELKNSKMVQSYHDEGEEFWVLEQNGRKYLVSHNLLP